MTRFQIMNTTCLWHRWFCNCGIVLCLQLPRHIGAKHIYLRHSPRRRVTVLRSCYIMFQAGNYVHCTKTVRYSVCLVRELGKKVGEGGWFLFWGCIAESWSLEKVKQNKTKQKKEQKKIFRLSISNPGCKQNTYVAFKN